MLKIAFVDHHLNNYHANKFLQLLRGPLAEEKVELVAAWESHPTGEDWCDKNGISRAATISEAVNAADAVMLLAPDNIEEHLALAREVIPFGKPVYIDKLLADSVDAARQVIALGREYNTPLFSSSALRYAAELEAVLAELQNAEVADVFVRGLNDLNRYGIHALTMALRIMGTGVKRVIDTVTPLSHTVTLDYGEGRRAIVDVRQAENEWQLFGWSFAARVGNKYISAPITEHAAFYENLLRRVLTFFKTGADEMLIEEAFVAVAIIEAANKSLQAGSEWVELEELD